ncbi:hypothetical protein BDZ45DRAFT_749932 [Acephala macrosclerotiorum]|nr:hypothetical protein BDZ45DRAFT_749932 [Acephala macrosclerotiorum]
MDDGRIGENIGTTDAYLECCIISTGTLSLISFLFVLSNMLSPLLIACPKTQPRLVLDLVARRVAGVNDLGRKTSTIDADSQPALIFRPYSISIEHIRIANTKDNAVRNSKRM